MEWDDGFVFKLVGRNGKILQNVNIKDIQLGDIISDVTSLEYTVVDVQKVARQITYEEFCKNAKKCRLKELRDTGKACFAEGTEILTNKGWAKVEDICKENPFIGIGYVFKGGLRSINWDGEEQPILATIKSDKPDKIRFDFENGSFLEVTEDHEMAVVRNGEFLLVPAKNVLEDDEIPDYSLPI